MTIIGVGIFNLPTLLASYGPISLVSMALTTLYVEHFINTGHSSGATAFTTLVLRTGITAEIPYGFSALAKIKWRRADQRTARTPRLVRDMAVAIMALFFSILFIVYSRNTGHGFWIYWAPFLLAGVAMVAGIPVYRSGRGYGAYSWPLWWWSGGADSGDSR